LMMKAAEADASYDDLLPSAPSFIVRVPGLYTVSATASVAGDRRSW
jgi:hypothetical protein